ncbi:MAG: S8 family serine peptidase [Muribaculaceae bacterium]
MTGISRILSVMAAVAIAMAATIVDARNVISPRSQVMLRNKHEHPQAAMTSCFIKYTDRQVLAELQALGVVINHEFGNIITAQVPDGMVSRVAKLARVQSVQTAAPMSLCNDEARSASRVSGLHESAPTPYTGRGVVVGMVDVGIDFNHVEFLDSEGKNRIKSVYLPEVEGGEVAVIDDNQLPGSKYETTEQITSLTTDCDNMSHGTHTTTTAAGSYKGNGFYGIATDAEIVACAMPGEKLTDVNIANSVAYIFDYARRVNRPAVVNMSLSSNVGPRDGTSMLSQAIANVTGKGRVCVLSIGNDGFLRLKARKHFTAETDTLRTFLENQNKAYVANGEVDAWADNAKPYKAQLVVYDRTKKGVIYGTEWYETTAADDDLTTIKADDDAFLSKYYTGEINFASGLGDNGKMELYVNFDLQYTCTKEEASNFYFGLRYVASPGTTLTAWSSTSTQLVGNGKAGWMEGTPDGAINDMATGVGVISVGSYVTKNAIPHLEGESNYNKSAMGDIMYSSGYGIDENGVSQPMITAPGYMVVSAMNRYDTTIADKRSQMAAVATIDGSEYMWREMGGTSMSAPVVTGIVATWLQADNQLDADAVKEILQATAVRDEFVTESSAVRWGCGKIDALAGLQYILGSGIDEDKISSVWSLTVTGYEMVITTPIDGKVIATLYDIAGARRAVRIGEAAGGRCRMTIGDMLQRGVYLVKMQVSQHQAVAKMVLGK